MNSPIRILVALALTICGGASAVAQHLDILVQSVGGKLATGIAELESGTYVMPQRIFVGEFPSFYATNDPGFNSLSSAAAASLPAGASLLPGNRDLMWDFVPMYHDTLVSNLLYWNGSGSVVDFGPSPAGTTLQLFGKNSAMAAADGSSQLVPGQTVVTTAANGYVHEHRFFFLDDGDNNESTAPANGVYLIAMQLRMSGLATSDPYLMLWGTPGIPSTALDVHALNWVTANFDSLFTPPTTPGDYNADGAVTAADYTVWRDTFGSSSQLAADGDHSGTIDTADYDTWRANFGTGGSLILGTAVPEPAGICLIGLPLILAFANRFPPRKARG